MPKQDIALPNESGTSNRKDGVRVPPYDTTTGKVLSQTDLDLLTTRAALRRTATPEPTRGTTTRASMLKRNLASARELTRSR